MSGTPPKSIERMRANLAALGAGTRAAGPLAAGLEPDAWIAVATFHDLEAGRDYQRMLLEAGVMSQSATQRRELVVRVAAADRQRAAELLAEHAVRRPQRARARWRVDWDYTMLAAVLAGSVPAIVLAEEFRWPRDVATIGAFALLGALTGRLVDQVRSRRRRIGRWQVTLADWLVLIALPAVALVAWRLLPGMIER
jgi:hypothetical protein